MSIVTTSTTSSMPTSRFSVFKRSRDQEEDTQVEELAMANCMMLLSRVGQDVRKFECKTCNRKFSSFQALGGHRASHKRPKFDEGSSRDGVGSPGKSSSKTHVCSICGMEFSVGQALGGHMRRHRREGSGTPVRETSTTTAIMAAPGVVNESVDSGSTRVSSFSDSGLIPFQNLGNYKIKTDPPILIQFF